MADKTATTTNNMTEEQIRILQGIYIQPGKEMAGVKNPKAIFLPKSKDEVKLAVQASKGESVRFASGFQQPAGNDKPGAEGSVVINLAQLDKVVIAEDKKTISAGVAVKLGNLAKFFGVGEGKGFGLPMGDNPHQSVISYLLRDTPEVVEASNDELKRVTPSCLQRTMGRLAEHLVNISVVLPNGDQQKIEGEGVLTLAKSQNAVITEMTFEAIPSGDLWMERISFQYPGLEHFKEYSNSLFLNRQIPKESDLVLDAFSSRYDMPMIRVTIAGKSSESLQALRKVIEAARLKLPEKWQQNDIYVVESFKSSEVMKNIFSAAFGIPEDPEIETIRNDFQVVAITDSNLEDQEAYLAGVIADINNGIGFNDDDSGKIEQDLRLFKRLRINTRGEISSSGREFRSRIQQPAEPERPKLQLAQPEPSEQAATFVTAQERKGILGRLLSIFESDPRIPGFKGHIYVPADGFYYDENAYQYATSSFDPKMTSPYMVAYPKDVDDIKAAIKFAKAKNKKVVARSGGHQYCGKSSGDSGTIVLSMDALNFVNDLGGSEVEVGPGVHLHQLADHFKSRGLTIPHGECPMVCIGGHAQTGGYGHLLRSFGLALDYVTELDIILANGQMKTVKRPKGEPRTEDELLFWGVLGGNAGSFGIVTRYKFDCIVADNYPDSYGYNSIRQYDKSTFYYLMKEAQAWTTGIVDGTLQEGLDFMMSVESSFVSLLPPLLVVELVQKDAGPSEEPQLATELDKIIQTAEQAHELGIPILKLRTSGKESLSNLSRSFVRDFPSTTWTGREFRYPYKKRLNCTSDALTDKFVTMFVDMLNKVVMRTMDGTDGIYLVFQMAFGGGELQNSERRSGTSIPRRDMVYCFVFDLFYDEGYEDTAKVLQKEMQELVNSEFSPKQEEKLFWGSFGETDMTKDEVLKCYYDDLDRYRQLQALKKQVDPTDLFHTDFSVQLPKVEIGT